MMAERSISISEDDFELPPIASASARGQMSSTSRNIAPLYVKHGFPELFRQKTDYHDYLPKLPPSRGAETVDRFGLMYNKPESEAEIRMHDLWLSKRKEEAFSWKAQQQLSLVLDRMSLHKSRLESDLLRRHEVGEYLRGTDTRPKSASSRIVEEAAGKVVNRFAPIPDPGARKRRILSGRISARLRAGKLKGGNLSGSEESDTGAQIYEDEGDDSNDEGGEDGDDDHVSVVSDNSRKGTRSVDVGDKKVVETIRRTVSKSHGKQKTNAPFRFRAALPLTYKQEFYVELSSDSEDEGSLKGAGSHATLGGKGGKRSMAGSTAGGHSSATIGMGAQRTGGGAGGGGAGGKDAGKKGGGAAGVPKVQFIREKVVNRERPRSAQLFRTLAETDAEFKLFYRNTNYRRMPLTERQERYLEERDQERVKFSQEVAKKLAEDQAEKDAKSKDKGKDGKKDAKKDNKGKSGKDAKGKGKGDKGAPAVDKPPPPKYSSAAQFMAKHFPNFDAEEEEDRLESCGPMRLTQVTECERVIDAFAKANLSIKESAVKKALLVPQDRPEAICLEGMRANSLEGLMVNPLPKEFWKKVGKTKKKGKGGGKKKKSKK